MNSAEPVTTVIGEPEMYINRGSTMNLTCVVEFSPEPPPAIFWTHNEKVSYVLLNIIIAHYITE